MAKRRKEEPRSRSCSGSSRRAQRTPPTRRAEKAPTMANPEQDGGGGVLDLSSPLEVVLGILRCLPARMVLRLRVVCRAWRDVASHSAVLAVLHRLQPSRPLFCLAIPACPDRRYIRLRDFCVEALDLRSDKLRSIMRCTGNTYCIEHNFVDDSNQVAPIEDFSVNYGACERGDHECPAARLLVHASLDGLLLVSFKHAWFLCNPATRQWADVVDLGDRVMLGFYQHSSGEYRVLGRTAENHKAAPMSYCVQTVGRRITRVLGHRPIAPGVAQDMGLRTFGLDYLGSLSPPVNFHAKLHWPPQRSQQYHIPVFDIETEKFSWMRPPPVIGTDMSLLEAEGKIAMSVSMSNSILLELWRLEDYENEIWTRMIRIYLSLDLIMDFNLQSWYSSVVSPEGDVLVECPRCVLHCDRNGYLLQEFWFPDGAEPIVMHAWRESLDTYPIFRAPKLRCAPPFYSGL